MHLDAARALALELMRRHGLQDRGWTVRLGEAKRRFGSCAYHTKQITLSAPMTELNDEAAVRDIILHEIAHAIAGPKAGHGKIWKAQARAIGCSADRCYGADVHLPPLQRSWFVGTCPGCQRQILRRSRRNLACGKCSPLTYKKKFAFRWRRFSQARDGHRWHITE
jgi:predicted SprT family Zn-dependent metalloprotease